MADQKHPFPYPHASDFPDWRPAGHLDAAVEKLAPAQGASVTATPPTPDAAVDHGIEESFPASDPVSVSITKVLVASDDLPPPGAEPRRADR